MSKWEKLLSRILSLSKDMRFDELREGAGELWICDERT